MCGREKVLVIFCLCHCLNENYRVLNDVQTTNSCISSCIFQFELRVKRYIKVKQSERNNSTHNNNTHTTTKNNNENNRNKCVRVRAKYDDILRISVVLKSWLNGPVFRFCGIVCECKIQFGFSVSLFSLSHGNNCVVHRK